MQARYYDPVIGRFYSNDPVGTLGHLVQGNVQGFNRYAYANNNPYRYTDPDGRIPVALAWFATPPGQAALVTITINQRVRFIEISQPQIYVVNGVCKSLKRGSVLHKS